MTTEERTPDVKELAHYVWESMDMGDVESYIVDSLSSFYKENPTEFNEQWKNYIEVIE
jgi:hypothetical protein